MDTAPTASLDADLAWTVIQEAAIGLILLDHQERVITWNGWMEQSSGIPRERILGLPLNGFFPTLPHSRMERAIRDALQRGLSALLTPKLNTCLLPLRDLNQQPMELLIQIKPLQPANRSRHCVIQIQDVTHAVQRDQRLRENSRALLRAKGLADAKNAANQLFLADIGHALRTPLNTLLGLVELLTETDDLHKARRQATMMQDAAQTLRTLVDDLRDYSQLATDPLPFQPGPFDLASVLAEVRDTTAAAARTRPVDFLCDLPVELPTPLIGDPIHTRQALHHLLTDLLRATTRGEIRLTVQRLDTETTGVRIGCTIHATGLLQPLLPPQHSTDTPGLHARSRLGTTIARMLIGRMGGTFNEHGTPGRDHTVQLTLPFALASDASTPPVHPMPAGSGLREVNILVVEDDEVNREVTRGMLKRIGIVPDMANNGQEALTRLATKSYDLVFMDCQMPTMDGLTACRLFRNSEHTSDRHTPIVALTAHAMKGDRERCMEAGMDDYLTKPVRGDTLRRTIQRWVTR
ncbi:MAG: response regulator [Magnetococcales bacterium]|nr:response regulator [Magnetococcales bacterium]NGZ05539.1 response regulator [Magnetococcales bacterium]